MFRKFVAATGVVVLSAGLALVAATPSLAEGMPPEPTDVAPLVAPETDEVEVPLPEESPSTSDPEEGPVDEPSESESVEEPADDPTAARFSLASMTTFAAAPTVQACAVPNAPTYVTNTAGMYFEDRTGGSHALTATGMDISWTGPDLSQAKSAGYIPVDVPFEQAGSPAMDYTVASGASAGLNLTLFKDGAWFGNLVLEPLFPQFWINKAVPGMPAGPNPGYQLAYGTLDEFLAAFAAASWDVDIRAIGYSGGSGSEGSGTVTSLTVGCDQYVFATPPAPTNQQCAAFTSIVVDSLSDLDLTSSRALGHQALRSGALRVWTDAAPVPAVSPDPRKAAGYLDVPDFPLTTTGTVGLTWTGTSPAPGGQLVVDLDGNGSPDGILVFEPAFYGQNLWLASIAPGFSTAGAPAVGGGGGPINGTIDQYLANWPNAKGLALGYSLGSGVTGSGLLTLIEAGCYRVTFDAPTVTNQVCTAYTSIVVDDLADLDLSQTRADGDNELKVGALRVWTGTATGSPDPRKAAGYLDVPDVPLSQGGVVALTWSGTTPPPGGQIVVDLDGNGSPDGILVFEPSFYGQNLWLASIAPGFNTVGAPSVGGGGGSINGSIDQYLANWPSARILALGYSLGSGVTGDGLLTLLQAGCYQVTFDKGLPTLADPGGSNGGSTGGGSAGGQLDTLAITGEEAARLLSPLGAALVLLGGGITAVAVARGRRARA